MLLQPFRPTMWTSMIILMTIGKGTRAESRFWIFSDLISNYISHDIHGKIYVKNRYFGILIISVTRKQFASRRSQVGGQRGGTLNGDGTLARPATNDQIIIICLTHASMQIAVLYFEIILTQTKTPDQKLAFIYQVVYKPRNFWQKTEIVSISILELKHQLIQQSMTELC